MIRQTVAVALAVLSTAVPSGCSSDASPSQQPPVGDVDVDPGGDAPHLPSIPDLHGAEGAVADATFESCGTSPGRQVVRGTVENSSDDEMSYVVAVSWIDGDSEVTQRSVASMADVAAGETVDFSVGADVPEGAVACTYYVLRAPAG